MLNQDRVTQTRVSQKTFRQFSLVFTRSQHLHGNHAETVSENTPLVDFCVFPFLIICFEDAVLPWFVSTQNPIIFGLAGVTAPNQTQNLLLMIHLQSPISLYANKPQAVVMNSDGGSCAKGEQAQQKQFGHLLFDLVSDRLTGTLTQ